MEIIGTPRAAAPSVAAVAASSVARHAIDATPARWRGDAGSSPLDGARTTASSPRNDFVGNCRVHLTHWLIYPQVDPDATILNSKMGPDAFATFVQFNGASDFQSIEDLSEAWRTLSDAELLSARVYVPGRENDAIYPLQYVASLTGRAILVANRRPTPPSFKPARRPKYYDVRASLKLKKFDRRILDAPPRMAMRLGERSYDVLQDEASDVESIEDSEDEAPRELLAPQPFDEDAMFEAAAAALDAAEAAERERAAAAAAPVPVAPAPAPPVTFESTAPPQSRERAPPPVSQPPKKRKKGILDTSSDED